MNCTCLSFNRDPMCYYHGDIEKVWALFPAMFPSEPSIPISQLRALSEQWKQRASEYADDNVDLLSCAADLDRLLLGETETQHQKERGAE